jgi:transcriptional regulator with XRE-family HTH domain
MSSSGNLAPLVSDAGSPFDFSPIREYRQRAGLTIGQLSSAAGVSTGVISKLERNQTSAELGTLHRIARVFGMNATDLLALAECRAAHRAAESEHRSGDFVFREIRGVNLRLLLGQASAGGRVSEPRVHRDDIELCWVLEGRVRVTLPHEQHELARGDSIQFDAIQPHTYHAIEECRVLISHLRKPNRF